MNATHKQAMQAGRKRYLAQQRRESIHRVKLFTAWLKAGSVMREIPCVPTDSDYALARAAGLNV